MSDQATAGAWQPEQLVETLLALSEPTAQEQLLAEHVGLADEQVADALKRHADKYLRSAIQQSLRCAELLIYLSDLTHNALYRALGLLAQGNAYSIGLGEYRAALTPFAEAFTLYGELNRPVGQARVEIGRMWALSCLGQYTEAFARCAWARQVLEQASEWRLLATATLNLAIIYCRSGDDATALTLYDEADALYLRLGLRGSGEWLWVQQSRAVSLRNMGRFDEAIAAGEATSHLLQELGQSVEAARAQQNLALTYFILGRHNEGLNYLDQANEVFRADGRQSDAVLVELSASNCLLQLRRFEEALEKCRRVRDLFGQRGAQEIVAQAIVNEAVAYTNLQRFDEAITSLQEAYDIFTGLGNQVWQTMSQLEMAAVLQLQDRSAESLTIAQQAAQVFQNYGLVVEAAQAQLVAVRAALALQRFDQAQTLTQAALATGIERDLPSLTYQAYQLLGRRAEAEADVCLALSQYDHAVSELERMRGWLMVEHRANFLEDKQALYEDAVRLSLSLGQPDQGLLYAERAKSRALLDLLAFRLDLRIQARRPEDQLLVEELTALRTQRDYLYRRWAGEGEVKVRGWTPAEGEPGERHEILDLEKRITTLWHQLLVHNADYARDASLWQVRTEPVQKYLPPATVLLEYYTIRGEVMVFVVTIEGVQAQPLGCRLSQIQRWLQLLQVNLNLTATAAPSQQAALKHNAYGLLRQLHHALIEPVLPALGSAANLVIVPHGPLHYLPFHAFYDGQTFLLEQYEISYLPGSSLLRYCQEATVAPAGALIYGHSAQGRLPNTIHEVRRVAEILGEEALVEDELTSDDLRQRLVDCRVVHLATHGDFRADNPLFSGLVVGDGWLTTLDIFNARLGASLVTLSGCQTGRTVVQGGDELAGLMRAFLSAGAASLVLSLWAVEDRSTAQLMQAFYQNLANGYSKGAALRAAQLRFIRTPPGDEPNHPDYSHPYFWAPFFLVGASGQL
jgi:CHAT domain-containing protein